MAHAGWLETEDGVKLEMELYIKPEEGRKLAGVAVISHPHPMFGGDMRNSLVRTLASASVEEGYVPLLFNFRGTGRSEGTHTGGVAEVQDMAAAMAYAKELVGGGSIVLMGYSFGAKMATHWLNGGGRATAFVGVAVPSQTDYPDYGDIPSLFISGEMDDVAPLDDGLTRSLMVNGIHVVVESADHFFLETHSEVGEAARGFIDITCPLKD